MPQEKKARGAEAVENRREVKRLKRKFDYERNLHNTRRSKVGRAAHRRIAEKHETEIIDEMRAINRRTREISRRK